MKIGSTTNGLNANDCKWGLIDENGKEVLPVEYDNIWTFYGKNRTTTRVEKDNFAQSIVLAEILNADKIKKSNNDYCDDYDSGYEYGSNYGEYAGSYAQDVEGYSDDVINDAFDGDPEAYWNID